MRRFVIAIALFSLAPGVHAQRGPEGVFRRVEADMVKGAPYAAEVVNESVQMLSDGNRILHRTTSRVYRDAEGRTRQETDRPVATEVSISDPVAGTSWTLNSETKTARQSPTPLIFSGNVNRAGELERLNVLINGQLSSFVARGGNNALVIGAPNTNGQTTEEKLSARTIEGLRVEGVRRTMTITAGDIGNERPIVVTSEEWTSPELKVLVLSESNDPRTGTSTYKLVNVKRGDPSPSLFQVPADYTIVQQGGRGEGRGEGRGGGRSGR